MTDYAMFANARVYVQALQDKLSAKAQSPVADALRRMSPGEHVVPLYDLSPAHGHGELQALMQLADAVPGASAAELLLEYELKGGGVPHLLRVTGIAVERIIADESVVEVPVEIEPLGSSLPASDFLRLRALDDTVAAQFKGSAPARPLQEVTHSLVASVRAAVEPSRDSASLLRSLSLVEAQNVETAVEMLVAAGRAPLAGDMAFLVTRAAMPGLALANSNGVLSQPRQPIAQTPEQMMALLHAAQRRATPSDPFDAASALAATDELLGLLNADESVKSVDDFNSFYEFRVLSRAVTQAIDLARRPLPPETQSSNEPEDVPRDAETAAALQGLSVEAVLAELPEGFAIERFVVAAAVASLRAGKHLLLGGPPGSGKTTLAEALCRAVVSTNYDVTTATADWTTFDTIGGYLPDGGGLKFVPGVVLRSLQTDGWLVIDEINRADIDKAFGPLFTVLSGGEGAAGRTSVLPYASRDGTPITIEWSSSARSVDGSYAVTPWWRLIGTLNVSDKASLFRLSFAFLRRFAVIDVPLPSDDHYRALFTRWFATLGREDIGLFVDSAMAVVTGPIAIGPAIGRDFASLVVEGLTDTASGEPTFPSDQEAILTAARLLVVPQYEGQPLSAGLGLLNIIDGIVVSDALPARRMLEVALHEVALS